MISTRSHEPKGIKNIEISAQAWKIGALIMIGNMAGNNEKDIMSGPMVLWRLVLRHSGWMNLNRKICGEKVNQIKSAVHLSVKNQTRFML